MLSLWMPSRPAVGRVGVRVQLRLPRGIEHHSAGSALGDVTTTYNYDPAGLT
jgi:hypothetical protein